MVEKDEKVFPCSHCRHYQGRHEIETLDTMGMGKLKIEIPVCGRITYVLAIRKCDFFIPTDLYMNYYQSKIEEEEKYEQRTNTNRV